MLFVQVDIQERTQWTTLALPCRFLKLFFWVAFCSVLCLINFSHLNLLVLASWHLPTQLSETIVSLWFFLHVPVVWKWRPHRKLWGQFWASLIDFPALRDHCSILPRVWCLKTVVLYIFLVLVFVAGKSELSCSLTALCICQCFFVLFYKYWVADIAVK